MQMAPKPVPAGGGKKLLGLNKWAWAGVAALGVLVYVYFRHQSNTKAAAVSNAPAPDASPIDTAALGGTPPPDSGGFDIGFLEALLDQQTASLEDFYSNYADMVGAGVYAGSGGPGGTTQAGAVSGGASADGASSASASSTQTTDVANTATFASDVFNPAPAPAPGESVATLSAGGVQITPGTLVTAPNPGAGTFDISSGIAGLGGAAGGVYVPPSGYATTTPYRPGTKAVAV
jgi:hypothetical protein